MSTNTVAYSQQKSAKYNLMKYADPQFEYMVNLWKFCKLCFEGELAIKAHADEYIPRPKSKQGDKQAKAWKAYIDRGKWPVQDSPAQILEKMVGILSAKDPEILLDGKAAALEYLREYGTSYNDGLDGLFRRTIEQVLRNGRHCLLLEPKADDKQGFHINEYRPDKFLRAEVKDDGNGDTYARLVLLDTSNIEFSHKVWRDVYHPQITLLALDAAGRYYQAKFGGGPENTGAVIAGYDRNGVAQYLNPEDYSNSMDACMAQLERFNVDQPSPDMCSELVYPTRHGKTLDRIPFTVCNTNNLHFKRYTLPPLLNQCLCALHILQADCDHQQAIYYTTDPIPVANGIDKEEELPMSSDRVLYLPVDGRFGFVTTGGAGLNEQRANLEQMRAELRNSGISIAGTEGAINSSGVALEIVRNSQTASLRIINDNAGKAIEEQLRFAGRWLGMNLEEIARDIHFTPSNDFAELKPGVQELSGLANIADKFTITDRELRRLAERYLELEVRDFEEVKAEKEAEMESAETNGFAGMNIPEVAPVTDDNTDDEEDEDAEDKPAK